MPAPVIAAQYRARDGTEHQVLVERSPEGRWRVLDAVENDAIVVDTLTGCRSRVRDVGEASGGPQLGLRAGVGIGQLALPTVALEPREHLARARPAVAVQPGDHRREGVRQNRQAAWHRDHEHRDARPARRPRRRRAH